MSNLGWFCFLTKNDWSKFVVFLFFQKIENFWKCFAKISVTKFRKWKIGDGYLLHFSMLFIVVYSVFSVDAFFMEKIAKQNRLFWQQIHRFLFFQKIENFWKCFAKISVTKFRKLKIGDEHFIRFSVFFVVVYFVFLSMHFLWRKLRNKIAFFSAFLKKAKTCLMEMALAPSFFKLWGF